MNLKKIDKKKRKKREEEERRIYIKIEIRTSKSTNVKSMTYKKNWDFLTKSTKLLSNILQFV